MAAAAVTMPCLVAPSTAALSEDLVLQVLLRLPAADVPAAAATCRAWARALLGRGAPTYQRLRQQSGWAQPMVVLLRTREMDDDDDDDDDESEEEEEEEDEEDAAEEEQQLPPVPVGLAPGGVGGSLGLVGDEAAEDDAAQCEGVESVVTLLDVGSGRETALPAHPLPCVDHAVVASSGRVYTMGGCDSRFKPVRAVHVLAPVPCAGQHRWEWRECRPMRQARAGAVALALDDGRLLVAGGWGGRAHLRSAEVYDPISDSWTAAAALRQPRAWAAAGRAGSLYVVAGGIRGTDGPEGCLACAEAYDPAQDRWLPAPDLPCPLSAPLFASTLDATRATVSSGAEPPPAALVCLGGRRSAEPVADARVFAAPRVAGSPPAWRTLPPLAAPLASGGPRLVAIAPTKVASFTGQSDVVLDLAAGTCEPVTWSIADRDGLASAAVIFC